MRIRIIAITVLVCWFSGAFGQPPITFKRTYGAGTGFNEGHSVVLMPDSGYMVVGSTSGMGNGATDILIVRADKNGLTQWMKTIGGPNVEIGKSIKPTGDGNYVICGYTNGEGFGGYDVFLAKINPLGDTLWTKTYGGEDWDFGYNVEPTSDGGFIMAGETYSFGAGNNDYYIVKTDADGGVEWAKTFGTDTTDIAYQIIENYEGNFMVVGNSNGFSPGGKSSICMVRMAPNGDTLKTVHYPGINGASGFSIAEQPADSGYYIGGSTRGLTGTVNNITYFQYNKGDTLTDTQIINNGFSTTIRSIAVVNDIQIVVAGESYAPGETQSFALAQKFSYPGVYYWGVDLNLQNKEENFKQVIPTLDCGFIAVGTVWEVGPGLSSVALVKMGCSGEQSSGLVLSDKKDAAGKFSIYPNPTTGVINIQVKQEVKHLSLKVYSATGALVLDKAFINTTGIEEDFSSFDNGLYILQINADGLQTTQRLLIAR